MRKHFSLLSFSVAVFCLVSMTGCWTARIWTVAPAEETTVVIADVHDYGDDPQPAYDDGDDVHRDELQHRLVFLPRPQCRCGCVRREQLGTGV